MNIRTIPRAMPANAEAWVVRLQSADCGAQEHAAFEEWLAADPRNPVDYANAERLHGLAGELPADAWLAADARRARRAAGTTAKPHRRRLFPLAAAAAVATLAGLFGYRLLTPAPTAQPQHMATAIGERVESVLEDGSRIVLDTDSLLEVAFNRNTRTLRLTQGRVHVEAVPDRTRPMLVHSLDGTVRVVGTTFQVRRLDGSVHVGVLEGSVSVSAGRDGPAATRLLTSGQQLSYGGDGSLSPVRPLPASDAEAWIHGNLAFTDSPLDALVREANRYSHTQLVLGAPELAGIRVSGVFRAGDQQSLADALQAGWNLHAERDPQGDIVLRPR